MRSQPRNNVIEYEKNQVDVEEARRKKIEQLKKQESMAKLPRPTVNVGPATEAVEDRKASKKLTEQANSVRKTAAR